MTQPSGPKLYDALSAVQNVLDELEFPFHSASAAAARREVDDVQALLGRYLLPRLRAMDAPLLVAIGGPTGSGKSTLVNAIVGADVTPSGVLRPTTRAPVLVHHSGDSDWFGPVADTGWLGGEHLLVERQISDDVPAGVALLDTPPIDSIAVDVRRAALGSLLTADLWMFVTTAARYADAAPWELLAQAAERRCHVVVALNRVPGKAVAEVRSHLAGLLAARGLADSQLFALREAELDGSGRLPDDVAGGVRGWIRELAEDENAKHAVIRSTVDGTIDQVLRRIAGLATDADVDVLDGSTRAALNAAVADVRRAQEEPA